MKTISTTECLSCTLAMLLVYLLFLGWGHHRSQTDIDSRSDSQPRIAESQAKSGNSEKKAESTNVAFPALIWSRDSDNDRFVSDASGGQDLWLQNTNGEKRFIAKAVVQAKLSPDCSKIAYVITNRELFVETVEGNPLAQIPRVCDPIWRADSMSLAFSAIPSAEIPELQQTLIYDLNARQVVELSKGN